MKIKHNGQTVELSKKAVWQASKALAADWQWCGADPTPRQQKAADKLAGRVDSISYKIVSSYLDDERIQSELAQLDYLDELEAAKFIANEYFAFLAVRDPYDLPSGLTVYAFFEG